MYKLFLFPTPAGAKCEIHTDSGYDAVAVPMTHPSGRSGQCFHEIPFGHNNGNGCAVKISAPGHDTLIFRSILLLKDGGIPWPFDPSQEAALAVDDLHLNQTKVAPEVPIPNNPPVAMNPFRAPLRLSAFAIDLVKAITAQHQDLAHGDDDQRRALITKVAEQFRFTFGPAFGCKKADAGRPRSKDSLAYVNGNRLWSWDMYNGATRLPVDNPDPTDLGDNGRPQVFDPVSPVNHLHL